MDQWEETQEGAPPSEKRRDGNHDNQIEAKSLHRDRPGSGSELEPPDFKESCSGEQEKRSGPQSAEKPRAGIEEQERQQSLLSAQNLREIRPKFIENVSDPTLKKLLLKLRQCEVITSNEEEKVRAPELGSDRARILFDTVTKKGEKASSILMKSLKEEDKFCFNNLMLDIDQ